MAKSGIDGAPSLLKHSVRMDAIPDFATLSYFLNYTTSTHSPSRQGVHFPRNNLCIIHESSASRARGGPSARLRMTPAGDGVRARRPRASKGRCQGTPCNRTSTDAAIFIVYFFAQPLKSDGRASMRNCMVRAMRRCPSVLGCSMSVFASWKNIACAGSQG